MLSVQTANLILAQSCYLLFLLSDVLTVATACVSASMCALEGVSMTASFAKPLTVVNVISDIKEAPGCACDKQLTQLGVLCHK